jgi:hypothetical protein
LRASSSVLSESLRPNDDAIAFDRVALTVTAEAAPPAVDDKAGEAPGQLARDGHPVLMGAKCTVNDDDGWADTDLDVADRSSVYGAYGEKSRRLLRDRRVWGTVKRSGAWACGVA